MTFHRRSLVRLLAVIFLLSAMSGVARSQFEDMAKYIPPDANALFMVNGEKLFSSEIAKSQNWQAQRGKRFDSGLTSIPANATQVVIGSRLDLEIMRPVWDAAVVRFATAPTLADISQHYGGVDDTIGKTPALRVADDAYITRVSDQLLAAYGPGNRQQVAQWLSTTGASLSPYLEQALEYEDEGTALILAIDAKDALSPAFVQQRLAAEKDPAITNAKIGTDKIVQILCSLKGVMLGITFGKQAYGKFVIDFGEDATPLADIAKPLVLSVLANHGALIEEMEDWTAEVKGNRILLGGNLDESGLLRIASLINLPTQALHAPASSGTSTAGAATTQQSPENEQQLVVTTTQQYFKSIEHLLADLQSRKGEERTIGQIGIWFQSYANKVDHLPLLHVDEEMLQYGQYVSQQLRNASMAIKGYGIRKTPAEFGADNSAAPLGGAIGNSVSSYYNTRAYGGYSRMVGRPAMYGLARRTGPGGAAYLAGRSEMRNAFAQRAEVDAQLKAGMATSVQGIMEQLREAHEKVRMDMTKKYQVEF